MFDLENPALTEAAGAVDTPEQHGADATPQEAPAPAAGVPTEQPEQAAPGVNGLAENGTPHGVSQRHAEAGRKGAHRVHQLINQGLLYEQEHGLTRGRQRLRQLIEEGKLYEQEHGLSPARPRVRRRLSRAGREQLMLTLFEVLLRMSKPAFRGRLRQVLDSLDAGRN